MTRKEKLLTILVALCLPLGGWGVRGYRHYLYL